MAGAGQAKRYGWLAVIGVGLFIWAGVLLFHVWTYSDGLGDTGSCGSVVDGSSNDSLTNLDVPGAGFGSDTSFCDHQRSTHTHEAIVLIVLAAIAGGWAIAVYRKDN